MGEEEARKEKEKGVCVGSLGFVEERIEETERGKGRSL